MFKSGRKIVDNSIPIIKEGVYLNYIDVFNQNFLSLENYSITKYQDKYCLLSNKSGRIETNFYGFSDGQSFYINLFRFSTVKVYAKTEIMGDYYFIDEVHNNEFDFSELRAGFGFLGMLVFPDPSELKLPLLIDRFTGFPVFFVQQFYG